MGTWVEGCDSSALKPDLHRDISCLNSSLVEQMALIVASLVSVDAFSIVKCGVPSWSAAADSREAVSAGTRGPNRLISHLKDASILRAEKL